MESTQQAVILAGGRGTRMRPFTDQLPKPMLPINGRPFIEYLIEMLARRGIRRVTLLLGYLPEPIMAHCGSGARFGVEIDYVVSDPDDETGTRLRRLRDRVDARFLLMYCDNYWPLRLDRLESAFAARDQLGVLTVYSNLDYYTKNNVHVAAGTRDSGALTIYDRARVNSELNGVDIGFGLFDRRALDFIPTAGNPSFEATVYPALISRGLLGGMFTDHRYYSIGSPLRMPLTRRFFSREPAVLVDRDGTLNERMAPASYVTSWSDFRWTPGALEALERLTMAGYRIVVLTNQPGIARGALTQERLDDIHRCMRDEAAAHGGRIDDVLYCPHGWHDGCDCRKPKPGLLFEAQRRFDLDLSIVTFIGDDDRDAAAAQEAGAQFRTVDATHRFADVVADMLQGERTFQSVS